MQLFAQQVESPRKLLKILMSARCLTPGMALIFSVLLLLTSCFSGSDTIVLKVAHNAGEDHAFQTGYNYINTYLKDSTDVNFDFQIFPASQIAGEKEAIEMIKLGVIASTPASAGALGSFVPEADLLNFPFLFEDIDHFYRVLDGPIGEFIGQKIEDRLDCIVLGWWFAGVRNVWNDVRPVYNPSDLNGLKIRVIGSSIVVDAFDAFGAQATNMSFGELYSALQQGVLDGAESDNTDLHVEKFYEVTKYVSKTEHMFLAVALLFSKKQFELLPKSLQEKIRIAGLKSEQIQRASMNTKTEESLEALKKEGLVFNEVDKTLFQNIASTVYMDHSARIGGSQIIQMVKEQKENAGQ